ncbi:hypothetical protein A2U01_0093843, partial [Trifolium medium]|nr:hypothetical protein [Trifolium medium]
RNAQVTVMQSDFEILFCAPRHISLRDAHSPEKKSAACQLNSATRSTPARRAGSRKPTF